MNIMETRWANYLNLTRPGLNHILQMIIPSSEIIAEEIKHAKIFDVSSLERSAGYLRWHRRQNRQRWGTFRVGVFAVPLNLHQEAENQSLARSSSLWTRSRVHHAWPDREPRHAHESLYVAQGCNSSGSLLCRVPRVPRRHAYTYRMALWSHHVTHNNPVADVRFSTHNAISILQIWSSLHESSKKACINYLMSYYLIFFWSLNENRFEFYAKKTETWCYKSKNQASNYIESPFYFDIFRVRMLEVSAVERRRITRRDESREERYKYTMAFIVAMGRDKTALWLIGRHAARHWRCATREWKGVTRGRRKTRNLSRRCQ